MSFGAPGRGGGDTHEGRRRPRLEGLATTTTTTTRTRTRAWTRGRGKLLLLHFVRTERREGSDLGVSILGGVSPPRSTHHFSPLPLLLCSALLWLALLVASRQGTNRRKRKSQIRNDCKNCSINKAATTVTTTTAATVGVTLTEQQLQGILLQHQVQLQYNTSCNST